MYCPSERTSTTASLSTTRNFEEERAVRMTPNGSPWDGLDAGHVLGLQALGALADFEFNRLALAERLVAIHLDGLKMHKDVLAGLALDEPVALAGVEPLHSTLFSHCYFLFCLSYLVPVVPPARKNKGLQVCPCSPAERVQGKHKSNKRK